MPIVPRPNRVPHVPPTLSEPGTIPAPRSNPLPDRLAPYLPEDYVVPAMGPGFRQIPEIAQALTDMRMARRDNMRNNFLNFGPNRVLNPLNTPVNIPGRVNFPSRGPNGSAF